MSKTDCSLFSEVSSTECIEDVALEKLCLVMGVWFCWGFFNALHGKLGKAYTCTIQWKSGYSFRKETPSIFDM